MESLKIVYPNYGVSRWGYGEKRLKMLNCLYLVLLEYLGSSNLSVVKQNDLGVSPTLCVESKG